MGEENRKGAPEEPGAFQKVLGALNQGQKIRALEIARKHGIPDDDPVWHVVLTVAEAEEGIKEVAQSLRSASVAVTNATADVVKANRDEAKIEIEKMQEEAKTKIANAIGPILETEIREAVNRLSMKTTAKKWLSIGLAAGGLVATLGISGAYLIGAQNGPVYGPMAESYNVLKFCEEPGWAVHQDHDVTYCEPFSTDKNALYGWKIPPLPPVPTLKKEGTTLPTTSPTAN